MANIGSNLPTKMSYVHQFSALFGTNSSFVKFICVAVCVGYCLSFSERAQSILCTVPGNLLPPNFWIWTCFTHNFIEVHWWVVLCDMMVMFLYGKLLEPLWGSVEMVIFFAVVNLSVVCLTTFTYLGVYLITQDPDYLFNNCIHGIAGYLAGFSVAVKQTMPDHVLINSPFGKLRNRHIPLLLIVAAELARLIGAVDPPFPIMFMWGSFVSWIYLRFYQRHSSGSRGDMTDSFSFASFFPARLAPFISVIANMVFAVLVRIKICRPPQRKYDVSAPTTITVSLPGASAQEVERRRLLAIKALNERLNSSSTATSPWPSMVDATGGTESPTEVVVADSNSSASSTPATTVNPSNSASSTTVSMTSAISSSGVS